MHRLAVCIFAASTLFAQVTGIGNVPPDLRFEVVSLKPSDPNPQPNSISGLRPSQGGQRYEAWNCTIRLMIQAAYRVKVDQVAGGPSWLDTDRFDMEAKAEKPSSGDELHVMLMNLLVDRLQLKFHREQREMSRYALIVDKGGPKLTPHEASNGGDPWIDQTTERFLQVKFKATFCPMDYLAFRLAQLLDRPVVDVTGLKGGYDFNLEFTRDLPPGIPETARVNGDPIDTSGPTVFAAIKQQLGLELKPDKGPVEVIVIDHAEKPAGN